MPFHTDFELRTDLPPERERLILSLFPKDTSIHDARYFDNYDLPCPIRVQVRLPDGRMEGIVLRQGRHGPVGFEAAVLRALERLGLPVPRLLAEMPPGADGDPGAMVLSLLPGTSLQAISMASPSGLEVAQNLLIEAVTRLSELTAPLEGAPVGRSLPRLRLADQLRAVAVSDSPWLAIHEFHSAIKRLRPVLERIATPLVFSNGDYQPGNFLADDGRLTGFLDFESACFVDPMLGFAKFPIYDIHPLNKAGLIDRLLSAKGWTREEFAPRLALGCLETLRKEIPVSDGDDCYQDHVLSLLRQSLAVGT